MQQLEPNYYLRQYSFGLRPLNGKDAEKYKNTGGNFTRCSYHLELRVVKIFVCFLRVIPTAQKHK
jgi:hypothetical protein